MTYENGVLKPPSVAKLLQQLAITRKQLSHCQNKLKEMEKGGRVDKAKKETEDRGAKASKHTRTLHNGANLPRMGAAAQVNGKKKAVKVSTYG